VWGWAKHPAPRVKGKEISMKERQIEKAAKEALKNIVDYLGLDQTIKRNAQLLSYIEWAIRQNI